MVVELFATSVAWATVLRAFLDVSVADDAEVLNGLLVVHPNGLKRLLVSPQLSLLLQ
mgnify:CR=1 FL=1